MILHLKFSNERVRVDLPEHKWKKRHEYSSGYGDSTLNVYIQEDKQRGPYEDSEDVTWHIYYISDRGKVASNLIANEVDPNKCLHTYLDYPFTNMWISPDNHIEGRFEFSNAHELKRAVVKFGKTLEEMYERAVFFDYHLKKYDEYKQQQGIDRRLSLKSYSTSMENFPAILENYREAKELLKETGKRIKDLASRKGQMMQAMFGMRDFILGMKEVYEDIDSLKDDDNLKEINDETKD